MTAHAYYDDEFADRPWTDADTIAAAAERSRERYDAAFAEAMRGGPEFWRDVDVDAIVEAVRRSVFSLGLSPQERHMIVFRAVAAEADKYAAEKAKP